MVTNLTREFRVGVIGAPAVLESDLFTSVKAPVNASNTTSNSDGSSPSVEIDLHGQNCILKLVFVDEREIQNVGESSFWPEAISNCNGILLCYPVSDRASFLNVIDLLATGKEAPTALVGWNPPGTERQVDFDLGVKLSGVFNVDFAELPNPETEVPNNIVGILTNMADRMLKSADGTDSNPFKFDEIKYDSLRSQLRELRTTSTVIRRNSQVSSALSSSGDSASSTSLNEGFVYPMPMIRSSKDAEDDQPEPIRKKGPLVHPEDKAVGTDEASDQGKGAVRPLAHKQPSEAVSTGEDTSSIDRRTSLSPSLSSTFSQNTISSAASGMQGVIGSLSGEQYRRLSRRLDILDVTRDGFSIDDAPYQEYGSNGSKDWKHLSVPVSEASSTTSTSSVRQGFTLEELIERLTAPNVHDMEFVKVFLMLYRKFLRPSELLDRLMDRFDTFDDKDENAHQRGSPINAVQLRVCNVLIHWCTEYWCDFHSDRMRFTMHVFLEIISSRPAYAAICQRLSGLVFREPPSDKEKDAFDWGVPDIDDEEEYVQTEQNTSSAGDPEDGPDTQPRTFSFGSMGAAPASVEVSLRRSIFSTGSGSSEVADRALRRRSGASTSTSRSSVSEGTEVGVGRKPPSMGSSDGILQSVPHHPFPSLSFLEIDNEAIAQQLNVLESEIFRRIKARDLLQHIWSRQSKGRHAPSVAASIGHFNFISAWVTTRILVQKKLKTRAKVLGKFMKIAQILRNSNNYNTLMAVLAGVNSAAVLRLRQTRKLLQNRQSYRNYQALEKLMSSERSFAIYRQTLRRSDLPCIPYLWV
ncbi:uncharacterized protein SPPG_03416 [Spizellomyces punctatus DAOM BR117]|uniref:Ras-GEF domain-containing protein n=1 Tax=Spizellomyces punctatus (strain DAOM BR117) TaxID=645134 RepID=A0A0L0HKR7_SPIPD|nr:uncharacterized protein SPPG_03416 [Spizellomyces punctatus DAOM BR117]KND01618.1 hypothetical protein SPPG_03416 [Spizellomyces punctatus DAOM BR117]|eukprot:XP_016609657.1 hypothetical protein SPPG_03416 [Spizellomyces punctatus DAOM BR117]